MILVLTQKSRVATGRKTLKSSVLRFKVKVKAHDD